MHHDYAPRTGLSPTDFDLDEQQQPRYPHYSAFNTWPPLFEQQTMDQEAQDQAHHGQSSHHPSPLEHVSNQASQQSRAESTALGIRTSLPTTTPMAPLQTAFGYSQNTIDPSAAFLTSVDLGFNFLPVQEGAIAHNQGTINPMSTFASNFGVPLHSSPIDEFLPTTTGQEQIHNSLASSYNIGLVSAPIDGLNNMASFQFQDFNNLLANQAFVNQTSNAMTIPHSNFSTNSSPAENWLEAGSLSPQSDNSWTLVNRRSLIGYVDPINTVSPQNVLHIRTDSDSSHSSDCPPFSARSVGSGYEEIFPVSPEPESSKHHHSNACSHVSTPMVPSPMSSIIPGPSIAPKPSRNSSSSSSPMSSSPPSTASSPKSKRRNSPPAAGVTQKVISKKKAITAGGSKDKPEKKIGRRKGPLRPEQRQQAHEIRKLRACLRCKFLKKVCDKGDPCGGCQPSHARLWQVPCTRIDIKDIGYFLKDYKIDYERHVKLGFSVDNIKNFSTSERMLYVTHGYGYCLPLWVREVYVHDASVFNVDWQENTGDNTDMEGFEVDTAHLSVGQEGITQLAISQYLDHHVDNGFEKFVDDYFEGTLFITQLLKIIYRYYLQTKMPVLRKGLKLVIAYALTQHITLITGMSEDEQEAGRIEEPSSRYCGQTCAPVMINFQVKKAMADAWRELMKEVLEELSTLYSSVYSGDKLKNWPTIFLLAALILSIWELMQFDVNYRTDDEGYKQKFCEEMEKVPVGVIVGLFSAISIKLPSFLEWDTRKHAQVLGNNRAVCDVMTEVRKSVEQHESYLRKRADCKFDRSDFDCLSNKFISKLVIRAN